MDSKLSCLTSKNEGEAMVSYAFKKYYTIMSGETASSTFLVEEKMKKLYFEAVFGYYFQERPWFSLVVCFCGIKQFISNPPLDSKTDSQVSFDKVVDRIENHYPYLKERLMIWLQKFKPNFHAINFFELKIPLDFDNVFCCELPLRINYYYSNPNQKYKTFEEIVDKALDAFEKDDFVISVDLTLESIEWVKRKQSGFVKTKRRTLVYFYYLLAYNGAKIHSLPILSKSLSFLEDFHDESMKLPKLLATFQVYHILNCFDLAEKCLVEAEECATDNFVKHTNEQWLTKFVATLGEHFKKASIQNQLDSFRKESQIPAARCMMDVCEVELRNGLSSCPVFRLLARREIFLSDITLKWYYMLRCNDCAVITAHEDCVINPLFVTPDDTADDINCIMPNCQGKIISLDRIKGTSSVNKTFDEDPKDLELSSLYTSVSTNTEYFNFNEIETLRSDVKKYKKNNCVLTKENDDLKNTISLLRNEIKHEKSVSMGIQASNTVLMQSIQRFEGYGKNLVEKCLEEARVYLSALRTILGHRDAPNEFKVQLNAKINQFEAYINALSNFDEKKMSFSEMPKRPPYLTSAPMLDQLTFMYSTQAPISRLPLGLAMSTLTPEVQRKIPLLPTPPAATQCNVAISKAVARPELPKMEPQLSEGGAWGIDNTKRLTVMEKVCNMLCNTYPSITSDLEAQLLVIEVQKDNGGKLAGLTMDDIIERIGEKVSKKISSDITECSICMELMSVSSKPTIVLQKCGHKFHNDCVKQWLKQKSECPLCRKYSTLEEDYPKLK